MIEIENIIIDGEDAEFTQYAKTTELEKLSEEIVDLKATQNQLTLNYAEGETVEEALEWLAENGDTTDAYILPDGFIYDYKLTEVVVENEGSGYTNALDGVTKNINKRWSHSGKKLSDANGYLTVTIPLTADQKVYINVPRIAFLGNYPRIHYLDASNNYVTTVDGLAGARQNLTTLDGVTSWTTGYEYSVQNDASSNTRLTKADTITQMVMVLNMYDVVKGNSAASTTMGAISENDDAVKNLIVSIGNPIEDGGGTTTIKEYKWSSTGHAFVPTDYDEEIANLVKVTTAHTEQILELQENGVGSGTEETEKEAYNRIKAWKYPIHEDAPVFLLETNKPAIPSTDWNTEAIYAKYDALMNANSHYIKKEDCGMASDNVTPIYIYHFKEPAPHNADKEYSETKSVILVVSGVHPTEQSGVWSMYYAMEEITTNPKLNDLRRNVHFIVMPMINPTAFTDSAYGVRNPDGIQVHYNFEVDFKYPTDSGYVTHGNRNHGGETPLSIPETQYFDAIMNEYKDNLACVLSCHNNDVDTQWGTGFVWSSCATHFMCNLGFRLVDKLSVAWREKYGTAFDEGVRWANEYALTKKAEGSSLFPNAIEQAEWDFRVGRASISGSGGTEYKQALKYGVHGINVEVCDRCMILDKDFTKKRTANVTTMGAETYINFFRTFMAVHNPLAKKEYAPNLPMES